MEVLEDRQGATVEVEPNISSGDYLLGFLLGTREALSEKQRDSITITIPQVNEITVGALIALYERTVSIYASLVNINAYHQPGVEAGKKAAASILGLQTAVVDALQQQKGSISLVDLASKIKASDRIEAIYKILIHLSANNRGAVLVGDLGKPATLTVSWNG